MAICGSRSESIQNPVGVAALSARTGLRWWMNDGVSSHESSGQIANATTSTQYLGDALNAAGVRTAARSPAKAKNDLLDIAAP